MPHSFSELFVAMLSPQTTYAQLNMCRCVASVIQSLKWAAHDRSVVAPYPRGTSVGRSSTCPSGPGVVVRHLEVGHHNAGSAHPTNADSMSRPLTSASRATPPGWSRGTCVDECDVAPPAAAFLQDGGSGRRYAGAISRTIVRTSRVSNADAAPPRAELRKMVHRAPPPRLAASSPHATRQVGGRRRRAERVVRRGVAYRASPDLHREPRPLALAVLSGAQVHCQGGVGRVERADGVPVDVAPP